MPVGVQQQVVVVTVQKTAEVPHVQFIDKVADMPVVVLKTLLKPVETPQVQLFGW